MKADKKNKWIAIGVTVIVSGLLTYWGILGIGAYGIALFIITPIFLGASPVVIYGQKRNITMREARHIGFLTLTVFAFGLIVFAMEGIICIAMAAPIALLLTWLGTIIGFSIIKKIPGQGKTTIGILLLAIPSISFIEKNSHALPELIPVVTSIEIDASPEDVWKNVIEFPMLKNPTELIFNTGIAYPINATINGQGVGAIRHCNFSTGSFVEPITIWDEPRLLKFDVRHSPPTMKEISFYEIDAPHLHGYFVSKQGQFKLTKLDTGKTLLEGTTWYYHSIYPIFYWQLWSDYIIHKIHLRVLTHIKETTEGKE